MLFNLKLPDYFIRSLSCIGSAVKLNAGISSCGREFREDASYNWNGLKRGNRDLILWQLTLSGHGYLDYEGTVYKMTPGSAMLLHIPHRHRYYFKEDTNHWDFFFIMLEGTECCRICRELIYKNGPVIKYDGISSSLETAKKIVEECSTASQNDQLKLSSMAYQFCMNLVADLTVGGSGEMRPKEIDAAVRFALQQFESPVGVDDMSEAAGLSRYYFSRLFHKYMNVSPGEFLRKLRLEKATRMLQSEQICVNEIALRSGFQSVSYFCRAFKQEFGMSPGQFRDSSIL